MILLGAAEFDDRALDFLALRAPAAAQIYNVTARANDLFDACFEQFAPRRSRGERALGQGLGAPLAQWLDLQLDSAEVTAWINALGIPLIPAQRRLCHWSFYTRDGALGVYQAILRRRRGWDIASLAPPPASRRRSRAGAGWCRAARRSPRPPRGIGEMSHPRLILPPGAPCSSVPSTLEWQR